MEEKINISAILKDKKNGIRLYSPIFGECTYCCVREDTNDICVKKHNCVIEYFNYEGLYFAHGEVMLFPSKSMRDWEKFSWKNDNSRPRCYYTTNINKHKTNNISNKRILWKLTIITIYGSNKPTFRVNT